MTVKVELSAAGIDKLIKQIGDLKKTLKTSAVEVVKTVADETKTYLDEDYNRGIRYDGDRRIAVSLEKGMTSAKVKAVGDSIAFIEFGAGVYYNGEESYPDRPPGVAGIGEYGHGQGNKRWWLYPARPGDTGTPSTSRKGYNITHGNPANMNVWRAGEYADDIVVKTAKKVLDKNLKEWD